MRIGVVARGIHSLHFERSFDTLNYLSGQIIVTTLPISISNKSITFTNPPKKWKNQTNSQIRNFICQNIRSNHHTNSSFLTFFNVDLINTNTGARNDFQLRQCINELGIGPDCWSSDHRTDRRPKCDKDCSVCWVLILSMGLLELQGERLWIPLGLGLGFWKIELHAVKALKNNVVDSELTWRQRQWWSWLNAIQPTLITTNIIDMATCQGCWVSDFGLIAINFAPIIIHNINMSFVQIQSCWHHFGPIKTNH